MTKPLVTYRCSCGTKLAYVEKGAEGPTITYREHIRRIAGYTVDDDRFVDPGGPTIVFDDTRPRWHTKPVDAQAIDGSMEFPIGVADCPSCRCSWRVFGSKVLEDYAEARRSGRVVVIVPTVF